MKASKFSCFMCTQRGELNLVCDVHTLFSRAEYGRRSRFAAVEGLLQNLFITYTFGHGGIHTDTNNTCRSHMHSNLFLSVPVLLSRETIVYKITDLGTVHEPPNPRRAGACGWQGSQPAILVQTRRCVDRTQCSMRTAWIDRQSCTRS